MSSCQTLIISWLIHYRVISSLILLPVAFFLTGSGIGHIYLKWATTLCVHVHKCVKKHRKEEIILEPGFMRERGLPHTSCLSSYPLDGKELGLQAVLKTCVKLDKHNSVPALYLPMVTSVNSATRSSFNIIYSCGKMEWKRVITDLCIAKFGDERENLIIAKSLS